MRARRVQPTEHQEQSAVIQWWDTYAPTKGLDPRLLIAVPNAAKRSYRLAAMLKAEGMRSGYPDLILDLPHPVFHGMRVEMKAADGRVSPDQREYHDLLRCQDYNVITAFGADEAIRAITAYVERARP